MGAGSVRGARTYLLKIHIGTTEWRVCETTRDSEGCL